MLRNQNSVFFRGYFSQGNQRYFIEPLSPIHRDGQEHALFKYDPDEKNYDSTCGTDGVLWAHDLQNIARPATRLVVCVTSFLFEMLSCILPWFPELAVQFTETIVIFEISKL